MNETAKPNSETLLRDVDSEYREGSNAIRGVLFVLLFSIPIWALIGLGVWAVVAANTVNR